jgi:predicted  nucleic acid-binding Zn-ribbon protein
MNELLQNLIKLQSVEFEETSEKADKATIAGLRSKIPTQILGHYDRLVARRKKGVAIVRDQVCTACHMRLPIGVIMTLMHAQDIQLCESCGRYLYLPSAAETGVSEQVAKPKPAKKTRKSKKSLQSV